MNSSLKSFCSVLWNAFLPQNVVLVQALGLCPILAIGFNLQYGVALSVCTTTVLIPTALVGSWLDNYVSSKLRPLVYALLSCLLLLGAALVLRQWISPTIYAHLYLFLPLMAVNTLFTYRSTGMASAKVSYLSTLADSLGSALGFGLVLCVTSLLREMAINGTMWGIPLGYSARFPEAEHPFIGYVLLGFMAAALQWMQQLLHRRTPAKEELDINLLPICYFFSCWSLPLKTWCLPPVLVLRR